MMFFNIWSVIYLALRHSHAGGNHEVRSKANLNAACDWRLHVSIFVIHFEFVTLSLSKRLVRHLRQVLRQAQDDNAISMPQTHVFYQISLLTRLSLFLFLGKLLLCNRSRHRLQCLISKKLLSDGY